MRLLGFLALLILLVSCAKNRPLAIEELNVPSQPMGKSVFLVTQESKDSTSIHRRGTAFALLWKGKTGLMTAWHVLKSGQTHLVIYGNGVRIKCGPFIQIANDDIAWCEMKLPTNWIPLKAGIASLNYGKVYSWGYPENQDRLTSYIGDDNGPALFLSRKSLLTRQVIGVAIPGMSGGPVLNVRDEVVAIVSHTGWPTQKIHYPVLLP